MTFEWDERKAAANFKKHHVAFEEAASVFLDSLAITFPDPDHSLEATGRSRSAIQWKDGWCSFPTVSVDNGFGSSARALRRGSSENSMKKESAARQSDDLRPQYDLSQLGGGVRGKYYRQATTGNNLVMIEPDLAALFPDSKAVNRALRVIADAAQTATASKRRRRA